MVVIIFCLYVNTAYSHHLLFVLTSQHSEWQIIDNMATLQDHDGNIITSPCNQKGNVFLAIRTHWSYRPLNTISALDSLSC